MMREVRNIALLWLLLWCCVGGNTPLETASESERCAQLADTGVQERALVRKHAHLNLPASFESPANSGSFSLRTTSKHHTRLHEAGMVALLVQQRLFQSYFGGHLGPQTVGDHRARTVLNRLCRWII